MSRGFFISLDGLDGTGKSTQCRLLADWLRQGGFTVTTCVDPGGTPLGQILRGILLDHRQQVSVNCQALLFMASRAQLVSEVIQPALERGEVVISDRFLLANVVYQGHADGLDVDLLWSVGKLATGGLEPDLTIILDMAAERAAVRRNRPADRYESRDLAFHDRVRLGYLVELGRRPESIRLVDADRPTEVVQEEIRSLVRSLLAGHSPMGPEAHSS